MLIKWEQNGSSLFPDKLAITHASPGCLSQFTLPPMAKKANQHLGTGQMRVLYHHHPVVVLLCPKHRALHHWDPHRVLPGTHKIWGHCWKVVFHEQMCMLMSSPDTPTFNNNLGTKQTFHLNYYNNYGTSIQKIFSECVQCRSASFLTCHLFMFNTKYPLKTEKGNIICNKLCFWLIVVFVCF